MKERGSRRGVPKGKIVVAEPQGEARNESMSSPEKVEYISVHVDVESLPEPGSCLLCGASMEKVPLEYELQDNPILIKNTEPVPGYRCQLCEAEYYDGSVTLMLDKETLTKLGKDSKLRAPLERRITLSEALSKPL